MGVSPGFGLGLADHPLNPLQALLGADELRAEMGGTEGHGKAPPCTQAPPPQARLHPWGVPRSQKLCCQQHPGTFSGGLIPPKHPGGLGTTRVSCAPPPRPRLGRGVSPGSPSGSYRVPPSRPGSGHLQRPPPPWSGCPRCGENRGGPAASTTPCPPIPIPDPQWGGGTPRTPALHLPRDPLQPPKPALGGAGGRGGDPNVGPWGGVTPGWGSLGGPDAPILPH